MSGLKKILLISGGALLFLIVFLIILANIGESEPSLPDNTIPPLPPPPPPPGVIIPPSFGTFRDPFDTEDYLDQALEELEIIE
ncbi:MAG: hypothetical protein COU08_00560 [Candidatus Harrisonbacteria bacterium CG10_big_fil_rev_8_21_14_0_10_42_17]|uniref:Uncharacterized protein n=1 Tax=Candidatus Harrisonbacteria bacterium CG10_big_fil_rev_8_21_14_0_10_42_17 TaxID=1974584 RepID=A0A2M6WJ61_9BACT|nr:MAG: hypothetical protein COU08_00560 [Candidatus Harrisonbacteria bacterium CG10_big_fil_rev_8_21_14_0_10_42_17]